MSARLCSLLIAASLAALAGAAPAAADFGYLGRFGTAGSAAGQFYDPYGIDSDSAGNLYVADTGNYRVQKLHADGTPFDPPVMWGTKGSGIGQFSKPMDIGVDAAGNVYVADSWRGGPDIPNNRIQVFDANGTFLRTWNTRNITGIAVHTDTTVDPAVTRVYAADGDTVQEFDGNGTLQTEWGSSGFGEGQFRDLWDVATDTAGNVYTVESDGGGPGGNHRVQKFDKNGTFIMQFDVRPQLAGQECYRRLTVEPDGYVDLYRECVGTAQGIRRFTPAGEFVGAFGCTLPAAALLGSDRTGRVFLNGLNNGLLMFGPNGTDCPAQTPPPGPGPGGDGGGGAGGSGGGGGADLGLTFTGTEGVTINAGAQFTNDPVVELSVIPPGGVTEVRLSNDGGFLTAAARVPAPNHRYAWTLQSSGPERLPKTVYVRFAGAGGVSPVTFTDDVILDQTPPTIAEAKLSGAGARSAAVAAGLHRYTLRLRASDKTSGVGKLQLATTSKRRPGKLLAYAKKVTVRATRAPRWVRVRDRAGNFSRWRTIRH